MAWFKNGLQFACTRCSSCCRHNPGYVFLSQIDLDTLCEGTKLDEQTFRSRYTRITDFGFVKRLSLTEKTNYDCIFWDNGCKVYTYRPLQCRAFPFWSSVVADQAAWNSQADDCPGINQGQVHSEETIQSWLDARGTEPFLEE